MSKSPLLRLRGVGKSYGGVQALKDVTLDVAWGEVHAICGENGAGKSTLIKLLAGIITPDQGEIVVDGQTVSKGNVRQSEAAGIAVMHQESTAFPDLNAVDNIFVGRELTRFGGLLLDRAGMRQRTRDLLDELGESMSLDVPIGDLPLAQRQMVALARALSRQCRLLIMDEPTASLSARETETLLQIIRQLRTRGVSVLYVSHRLEEIFKIADRVTVLRDGVLVATRLTCDVDSSELIKLMVGREIHQIARLPTSIDSIGEPVLDVQRLTRRGSFQDISFTVRAGEIVGLTGLVGAGRSEIVRSIFGIDRPDSGCVRVAGQALRSGSVPHAVSVGMALVPEDRQQEGLVLPMTVAENISLATLRTLTRRGLVSRRREADLVARQMRDLSVKSAGSDVPAETLSGGNQQKLVLAKWLATQPCVLLLDEPTRGIDVGAKEQVHHLIRQLAGQGMATLVISSEFAELLSLCDRLLVIREGRIVGQLSGATATQEEVLQLALPDVQEVLVP